MEKLALTLPGGNKIEPIQGMPSGGTTAVAEVIQWGFTISFIIITIAALIFLIWSGIQWIASQGDKGKIESARKRLTFAIVGLIVAFSSYMIINTVGDFFGVKLLNTPDRAEKQCRGTQFGRCPAGKVCRLEDNGRYRCGCRPGSPGCAF
jgi:hypothetical protein